MPRKRKYESKEEVPGSLDATDVFAASVAPKKPVPPFRVRSEDYAVDITYEHYLKAIENNQSAFTLPVDVEKQWYAGDTITVDAYALDLATKIEKALMQAKRINITSNEFQRVFVLTARKTAMAISRVPTVLRKAHFIDCDWLGIDLGVGCGTDYIDRVWPGVEAHVKTLFYQRTIIGKGDPDYGVDILAVADKFAEVERISTPVDIVHVIIEKHRNMTALYVTDIRIQPWIVRGLAQNMSLLSLDLDFDDFDAGCFPDFFLASLLEAAPFAYKLTLRGNCRTDTRPALSTASVFMSITCLSLIRFGNRYNRRGVLCDKSNSEMFLHFPGVTSLCIEDRPDAEPGDRTPRIVMRCFPRLRVLCTTLKPCLYDPLRQIEGYPSNVLLGVRDIMTAPLSVKPRTVLDSYIQQHNVLPFAQIRQWIKITTLIAFHRANKESRIANSVMPLLPLVASLVGELDVVLAYLDKRNQNTYFGLP